MISFLLIETYQNDGTPLRKTFKLPNGASIESVMGDAKNVCQSLEAQAFGQFVQC